MCQSCHSGLPLRFEVVDEAGIVAAATAAHESGQAWHFHVLAPGCTFSPKPGAYTFLLELTDAKRALCAYYDDRPTAVNKQLLPLLHGVDALAEKKAGAGLSDEDEALLATIEAAAKAGTGWHHHMMFPACGLNTSDGKWRLFVEIAGSEPKLRDYAEEPSLVLNRIERLYFGLT
ncbi:hypothetical protein KHC23_06275 [Ancylobacter dichloromethanicus]|uniref:Uncharacterized protein n=1 Tax=Ancylobacter dichloromethanicus TaxID=518825 RepID=A0A9W6N0I5_9HYPH|nr:hypothetical protein [Ancylobacter dichloromethanicus]MBS7553252.1 hypothetical protein [Ancylobacter dichloromethanicus]GLK73032.1 hypothetical protein GCM10017643_31480 [Ancylobacter dichloromethanicus]